MTKVVLNDLVNLENQTSAVNTINANNAVIETAFDNTLSRDGTQPNTMLVPLDMNSQQILNLPAPSTINSPARVVDVVTNPTIVLPGTGTSGHVVPFLDTPNTWSSQQTFSSPTVFTGQAFLTNPVLSTPTLGTPISGNLINCIVPISTITGFGTGVTAFLVGPTSNNLKGAVSDETGSGFLVFNTSPTLITPILGDATATSVTASGTVTGSIINSTGYIGQKAAVLLSGTSGTVGVSDSAIVVNASGSFTITLPTPTSGRTLYLKSYAAQTVTSASANIEPLVGGALVTAIFPATTGRWAILIANGSYWEMMASN